MTRAGGLIEEHNPLREEWLEDDLRLWNYEEVEGYGGKTTRSAPIETVASGRIERTTEATQDLTVRGAEAGANAIAYIDADATVHGAVDSGPYATDVIAPSGAVYRVIAVTDLRTGRVRADLSLLGTSVESTSEVPDEPA